MRRLRRRAPCRPVVLVGVLLFGPGRVEGQASAADTPFVWNRGGFHDQPASSTSHQRARVAAGGASVLVARNVGTAYGSA